MKTPFRILKHAGAPDEVIVMLSALLLAIGLAPWLDITVGNITIGDKVPWIVSPVALLIFVLLFVPFIPFKEPATSAEKELRYRFEWLRRYLLVENLTVEGAREAKHALDGSGGVFRAAENQFRDKHIEPILHEEKGFIQYHEHVARLRDLCNQLPQSSTPYDMVKEDLALALRETVSKLPLAHYAQQSAAAGATTRRG